MTPPLIAHIIYRLDFGGLENGLVNLINGTDGDKYRHAVICMDRYTEFSRRITKPDVPLIALHKQPGHDLGVYWRLWRALRRLRPTIVHSRNVAAIEACAVAQAARVPYRVHGEHGRDMYDLDGQNQRHQTLRRWLAPCIHRFVPLSQDLESWLVDDVGIEKRKVRRVCNGVDMDRFSPSDCGKRELIPDLPFAVDDKILVVAIGRMAAVKDPLNLVEAFCQLMSSAPELRDRVRLMMAGDGELRAPAQARLAQAGLSDIVWLPGARDDVNRWLQVADVFVLPSLGEGISNTILEAMATGVPVIATDVGGNGELVVDGETGTLVPRANSSALAAALRAYIRDPSLRLRHGEAGRERCRREFSIAAMIGKYEAVYDELLSSRQALKSRSSKG